MTKSQAVPEQKFLRLPAVINITGRSRSAIYRDKTFPRPIRLGPNTSAWIAEQVIQWCDARIADARDDMTQPQQAAK